MMEKNFQREQPQLDEIFDSCFPESSSIGKIAMRLYLPEIGAMYIFIETVHSNKDSSKYK